MNANNHLTPGSRWLWMVVLIAAVSRAQQPTETPASAAAPTEAAAETPAPEAAPAEAAPAEAAPAAAVDANAAADDWGAFAEAASTAAPKVFEGKLYGYIDTHFENDFGAPTGFVGTDGKPLYDPNAWEWNIADLHVMTQGSIYGKYRFFVNMVARGSGLIGNDTPVSIRNAWVEAPLFGSALQVRVGKMYRRFGLYNEILDAVPTFIGIEPPELFDPDHLMLTRTTNAMVHGSFSLSNSTTLSYSVNVGDDERIDNAFPVGGDLRLDWSGILLLGSSFYWSGGPAKSAQTVGGGSPSGGVATWMSKDQYFVTGAFAQLTLSRFTFQTEYWYAGHDAQRDPTLVGKLADVGLTPWQLQRFFNNGDPTQGTTNAAVKYAVQTFYFRTGYEFSLGGLSTLTPYLQLDWYQNPEEIIPKKYGGDDEAGRGQGGQFFKYTAGGVFRPVPQVALKLDYSTHAYVVQNQLALEHEVRASFSYLWEVQP